MNLAKPYDQPEFLDFLKDFLPDFEKDISPVNLLHDFKTIDKVTHLGRSETLDLDIYEFKAIGKSQKKISQAIESFKVIKQQMSFRALVSYQTDDDENWRLALLQMTPDLTEEGKRTQKFSNPRRYSFLLGPTAKINTPKKFLDSDKKISNFDDLEKRFSVEVVNKDFYNQIAYFFSRLTGGDRKSGSKQLHFEPEMTLPPQSNPDKNKSQEFAVRLIGRIIFCWFLKQKKSKNDLSLLPEKYLSSDAVRANKDYYHNILEKVFFEVLNKPADERKSEVLNDFNSIPYLNGGLFDPHEDDHYNGQPFWVLKIPDKWFEEFFEILETYNFTIDENTVIDTDLSIDPEMLGRIFENLLAEINPETGESARKSTGSYYTPRPIVEYMVDQSLIQYLLTKTAISEEKIKALVSIDLEDDQSAPLTYDEKIKIIDALDIVKIIDPACGSGAFPIGILQKIVFMLGQVDSEGKLWFEKKLESSDPLLSEDIKRKFEKENFDYIRKTGVIRDSIYGVDIQPIAVEVSKLRCFLTLIVDEEIDDNDPKNRGIKPLPNLEFKFVAANTLIGLPDAKQGGLFEDHDEINRLKDVRDRYFVSNGMRKEQLKTEFYRVKNQMSQNQIFKGGEGHLTMALAAWDPFSNKSSEWFDPEWMLGVNQYDIAIGNPPYVNTKRGVSEKDKEVFKNKYIAASGQFDLFTLFIEKGLQLSRNIVSFIVPKPIINNENYEISRRMIIDNGLSSIVIGSGIFESAGVESCVFVLNKTSKNKIIKSYKFNSGDFTGMNEFSVDLIEKMPFKIICAELEPKEADLIEKIAKQSHHLIELVEITRGVETGKKDKSITNDDSYNRLLFGEDVFRYAINFSNHYIKFDEQNSRNFKPLSLYSQPKIVVRRVANEIISAYDNDKFIVLNTLYCLTPKSNLSDLIYLTGLLNSRLLSFWFKKTFVATDKLFPYVRKSQLELVPISTNLSYKEKIVSLVINQQEEFSDDTQKQIDDLVYKLYGLLPEEIKIIEAVIY